MGIRLAEVMEPHQTEPCTAQHYIIWNKVAEYLIMLFTKGYKNYQSWISKVLWFYDIRTTPLGAFS